MAKKPKFKGKVVIDDPENVKINDIKPNIKRSISFQEGSWFYNQMLVKLSNLTKDFIKGINEDLAPPGEKMTTEAELTINAHYMENVVHDLRDSFDSKVVMGTPGSIFREIYYEIDFSVEGKTGFCVVVRLEEIETGVDKDFINNLGEKKFEDKWKDKASIAAIYMCDFFPEQMSRDFGNNWKEIFLTKADDLRNKLAKEFSIGKKYIRLSISKY